MLDFYKGKKVFVTGHTGFKGSWLCQILVEAGAEVTGYALCPSKKDSLFYQLGLDKKMTSIISDIRDFDKLKETFDKAKPEIVIHLAAQPLVRLSYDEPRYTYETNVMGTINLLECIRLSNSVKSFLNVTTDKVYKNNEWEWGYRENDVLDGFDPYSNSKSCSELVTHCYINSFFEKKEISISTARAGNVIGGGDYAKDRIIPDCVRASLNKEDIIIRNPYSIRPFQHVLEPLFAYLMIVEKQYENKDYAGFYNVGPNDEDCVTTGVIADLFCEKWGDGQKWISKYDGGPHEANFLKLDCSHIRKVFGWKPTWNIEKAIEKTVEFYKSEDIKKCMIKQIKEFNKERENK